MTPSKGFVKGCSRSPLEATRGAVDARDFHLFNGVQVGAESTASPGTAVSATKLLNYLNFQPTFWAGDFNVMRPMGQRSAPALLRATTTPSGR